MSREEDRILLDPIVAPSGMFVRNVSPWHLYGVSPSQDGGGEPKRITLFNPMQPHVANEQLRLTTQEYAGSIWGSYRAAQPVRVIQQSELDNYGEVLVSQVATNIAVMHHEIMIFPLRGARQPGILHKAATGQSDQQTVVLKYTNWSNSIRREQLFADLRDRLAHHVKERETLNIGVLDTATGGDGSNNLAHMLIQLHDMAWRKMLWQVHFHLIHKRDRYPERARFIEGLSTESVSVSKTLYPVDDLLVEDWSEGIGLEASLDGHQFRMRRLTVPGFVAVQDSQGVTVYESEDLSRQMTQFIAASVNEAIFTADDMQYVKDVWQEGPENTTGPST